MAEPIICSMPDCNEEPRYGQRYCPKCHSAYMRAWRAKKKRQQKMMFAEVLELRQKYAQALNEIEELREKLAEMA